MRQIVLLRGVNLDPTNRVWMPELRKRLKADGFGEVATYLQSGNVVLSSDLSPERLRASCAALVHELVGREIAVVTRTRDELAQVVERNPLGDVATDPKRYQVSFLSEKLDPAEVRALEQVAAGGERLVASGRELYAWHPVGVARSKLWARLAAADLGVSATARNWTTVTKLLELADGPDR